MHIAVGARGRVTSEQKLATEHSNTGLEGTKNLYTSSETLFQSARHQIKDPSKIIKPKTLNLVHGITQIHPPI